MAETDESNENLQAQEPPAETNAAPPAEPQPTSIAAKPVRPKMPPKEEKSILIPLLTVLLVLIGIGEAVLCGYITLGAYQGIQAQKEYEAQLEAARAQNNSNQGTVTSIYYGPWRKEINGEVVWLLEDDLAAEAEREQNENQEPSASTSSGEETVDSDVTPNTGTPSDGAASSPNPPQANSSNSGTTKPNSGTQSSGSSNKGGSNINIKPQANGNASSLPSNGVGNVGNNATVYVSNYSNTIHSIPDCSNMKNYREMTREQADANKYKYCENCW